ncbi:MAG: hypothetical protein H0X01_11080, partial [Nitrospira sp.]|nr:hypothetical protein [Nitrospira sp.]
MSGSGRTTLASEAIMCFFAGSSAPGECTNALTRYLVLAPRIRIRINNPRVAQKLIPYLADSVLAIGLDTILFS